MTDTRGDLPLTHIVVGLRGGCWERLLKLVTDPDPGHQRGGFQDRKRKWRSRINEAERSIALDADDIEWVQRQIVNRDNGGWQQKVADIFIAQHPLFTRLPRAPRKRPEDRKRRTT